MELHAFTLLCGLGAVTCSAHIAHKASHAWLWLITLLAGLLILSPIPFPVLPRPLVSAQASHAALLIALAATGLLRRQRAGIAVALGGLLAAEWITALLAAGYPLLFALLFPVMVSVLTIGLALRRPGFRGDALLQEALVIVLAVALAVGFIPELVTGWRSATTLQGMDTVETTAPLNKASVLIAALCVLLGILYTRWKYK